MKNVFVVLLPQIEYLGSEKGCSHLYNRCIKERYQDKGYDIVAVNYMDEKGFVNLPNMKRISADITFKESSPYFTEEFKSPNFEEIAKRLHIEDCDKIVLGGFHCFDCVQKLAMEIYKLNPSIIIDTELTEMFTHRHRMSDFDYSSFNPNQKVESFLSLNDQPDGWEIERMLTKYSHPIWGMTEEYKNNLKTLLDNCSERED